VDTPRRCCNDGTLLSMWGRGWAWERPGCACCPILTHPLSLTTLPPARPAVVFTARPGVFRRAIRRSTERCTRITMGGTRAVGVVWLGRRRLKHGQGRRRRTLLSTRARATAQGTERRPGTNARSQNGCSTLCSCGKWGGGNRPVTGLLCVGVVRPCRAAPAPKPPPPPTPHTQRPAGIREGTPPHHPPPPRTPRSSESAPEMACSGTGTLDPGQTCCSPATAPRPGPGPAHGRTPTRRRAEHSSHPRTQASTHACTHANAPCATHAAGQGVKTPQHRIGTTTPPPAPLLGKRRAQAQETLARNVPALPA
jgi:hypothetical protein